METTRGQTPQEIRERIRELHDQERSVVQRIALAVLAGKPVSRLRRERRDVREALEDLYAGLELIETRPAARALSRRVPLQPPTMF